MHQSHLCCISSHSLQEQLDELPPVYLAVSGTEVMTGSLGPDFLEVFCEEWMGLGVFSCGWSLNLVN